MREILELAVMPPGRMKLGSLLHSIGSEFRITDQEFEIFTDVRDRGGASAADLG